MRNLERHMKRICEKLAFKIVTKKENTDIVVEENNLREYIGLPIYSDKKMYDGVPPAGIIIGLAYNAYGGSILYIETSKSTFDVVVEKKL